MLSQGCLVLLLSMLLVFKILAGIGKQLDGVMRGFLGKAQDWGKAKDWQWSLGMWC